MEAQPEGLSERDLDALVHRPAEMVKAIRDNPAVKAQVVARLAHYAAMERVGRLPACWVSRRAQDVMQSALDAANQPNVSEGV